MVFAGFFLDLLNFFLYRFDAFGFRKKENEADDPTAETPPLETPQNRYYKEA